MTQGPGMYKNSLNSNDIPNDVLAVTPPSTPVSAAAAMDRNFLIQRDYHGESDHVPETPRAPPPTPASPNTTTLEFKLSVPTTPHGHDISISISPKKAGNIPRPKPATPLPPFKLESPAVPAQSSTSNPRDPPDDVFSSSHLAGDPTDVQDIPPLMDALDIPAHRRTGASQLQPRIEGWPIVLRAHRVPEATTKRFPPTAASLMSNSGWTTKRWYVVARGHDFGIFFDFWYVFLPSHYST
jgi:hypothetical protein